MEPTFERYIYPNTVPLHLTIPLRPEQGHLTHQSCNLLPVVTVWLKSRLQQPLCLT